MQICLKRILYINIEIFHFITELPDIEEKDDDCDYCDNCDGTIKITSCDNVGNKFMNKMYVGSASKFQKPKHHKRR